MQQVMNGVSILEFAYLAQDVYRSSHLSDKHLPKVLPLWTKANEDFLGHYKPHWAQAFFARLYFRHYPHNRFKYNAAVIAYRGTMPFSHWENDIDDLDVALGKMPYSEIKANYIYTYCFRECLKHHNLRVKLTGHSLGGALAQLTAIKQKTVHPHTVVFNSPGIGNLPIRKEPYTDFICNVNSKVGEFNQIGKTVGDVIELEVEPGAAELARTKQNCNNPTVFSPSYNNSGATVIDEKLTGTIKQHVIKDIVTALKKNPAIANEIF